MCNISRKQVKISIKNSEFLRKRYFNKVVSGLNQWYLFLNIFLISAVEPSKQRTIGLKARGWQSRKKAVKNRKKDELLFK